MDAKIPRHDWASVLQEFTNRNAGRRTVLEIDGVEVGAQTASDYPLRGIAYDPRDDRIEIMLGEQGRVDWRLTHSVQEPTSIDVLQTANGRAQALRIAHAGAQTLLRFPGS
jgi:hypothetical protein